MSDSKSVLYDVQDGVAHITFNRPEAMNTLNADLILELKAAATACEARAVLLSSNGPSFCGGGDIKTFARELKAGTLQTFVRDLATEFHGAISRLARLDAPLIAAVHGAAAGAGISLACAADIVLAADTAKFRVAYSAIGVIMDGGSTYFLPASSGRAGPSSWRLPTGPSQPSMRRSSASSPTSCPNWSWPTGPMPSPPGWPKDRPGCTDGSRHCCTTAGTRPLSRSWNWSPGTSPRPWAEKTAGKASLPSPKSVRPHSSVSSALMAHPARTGRGNRRTAQQAWQR